MFSFILLALAFTAFSLVLAWLMFMTAGYFKTKIFAAIFLVALSTGLAFSLDSFMGYPTYEGLPDNGGILEAAKIVEPIGNKEGAIYLWINITEEYVWTFYRPFAYANQDSAPRAFRLPYSNETEKSTSKALQAMARGMRVTLKAKGKTGSGVGMKGDGSGAETEDPRSIYLIHDPRTYGNGKTPG